jgi:hypothetical protein
MAGIFSILLPLPNSHACPNDQIIAKQSILCSMVALDKQPKMPFFRFGERINQEHQIVFFLLGHRNID